MTVWVIFDLHELSKSKKAVDKAFRVLPGFSARCHDPLPQPSTASLWMSAPGPLCIKCMFDLSYDALVVRAQGRLPGTVIISCSSA